MTEQKISDLQSRIDDLERQVDDLRGEMFRAQLEVWEGRLDDLQVRLHLGSMELNERLSPLMDELRNRWLDAKELASSSNENASEALDTLRAGFEKAMQDLRDAVTEARAAANA